MAKKKRLSGVVGMWSDDHKILVAATKMRDAGYKKFDAITPFPVHGLDKALGLKKTRISDAAFIYALYGVTIAVTLTAWIMNHDWPQNIGGKPSFDWLHNMPAFVDPMFALMEFCSAHLMSLTFLVRNKMYPGAKPQNPDPRTTDDKFMMEFVSDDVETIKQLLIDTGVEEITVKDA